MRNTFINTLCSLADAHDDVFLLCGDLGYSVLEPFATAFPDRFLNVGVSEQNMTQVAAGLAREGYNVFTYSIGNFPTLRCMEQIRYDVCYHESSVKVVAVGAGYAYGPQGVSHHTTEDIAMLRAIPNMTVCAPADAIEARAAAEFMVKHRGPGYVRINKSGEPAVHAAETALTLTPGEFIQVRAGRGAAVLVTGAMLGNVVNEVRDGGLDHAVYSVPFIGNYSHSALTSLAQSFNTLITVEEHQLNGGFGGSIVEALSDLYSAGGIGRMPKVRRIAIPNRFIGVSGSQEYLRARAQLTLKALDQQ
ncbi:putative transketolase C-terminal part [Paraburkholderia piptadeniae]|uniref:Transketolase C-terminal part n=1 Tax=Paraburkholderia piptadeniae TaxID=1701573 RepID=A0A1N7ST62_9BURK|nr:transketolase C-terminal domain-containing protein [Paraburkholderia piptadeniae]SIT50137.1 putative transketolase C-terminal part [Paraburkholderia piptadeniae]